MKTRFVLNVEGSSDDDALVMPVMNFEKPKQPIPASNRANPSFGDGVDEEPLEMPSSAPSKPEQ